MGSCGFCLKLALRPAVQHSPRENNFNLERVIRMPQRLSAARPKAPVMLLLRPDSGLDSAALMPKVESCNRTEDSVAGLPQVDWLTKWNPRSIDAAALEVRLDADAAAVWHDPRERKRMTVSEEAQHVQGITRPKRRVVRIHPHPAAADLRD